jgi:hypothetical protein
MENEQKMEKKKWPKWGHWNNLLGFISKGLRRNIELDWVNKYGKWSKETVKWYFGQTKNAGKEGRKEEGGKWN